jgi:hypothetical protein
VRRSRRLGRSPRLQGKFVPGADTVARLLGHAQAHERKYIAAATRNPGSRIKPASRVAAVEIEGDRPDMAWGGWL